MTDDLGRKPGEGASIRGPKAPEDVPRGPKPRSQTRDLERYAALFAGRTRGMKSSAMRDVMSLAQGSQIISLAGGLPDTSTFGEKHFADLMKTVSAQTADALQYGPTEGIRGVADVIVDVMAAES